MSSFHHTFREIVIPDLRRMCASRGLFIALGMEGWGEAFAEIFAAAQRRGAAHLPDQMLAQLEDWIADELLKAITAAEPLVQKAEAASDKAIWRVIMERPWPTKA